MAGGYCSSLFTPWGGRECLGIWHQDGLGVPKFPVCCEWAVEEYGVNGSPRRLSILAWALARSPLSRMTTVRNGLPALGCVTHRHLRVPASNPAIRHHIACIWARSFQNTRNRLWWALCRFQNGGGTGALKRQCRRISPWHRIMHGSEGAYITAMAGCAKAVDLCRYASF